MNLNDIERRHDRLQWFSFIGVTIGSSAFALQELIDMLGGNEPLHTVFTIVGGVGWILACWAIYSTSHLIRHDAVKAILEDERMAQHRSSAFEWGFGAIFLAQLILMVSAAFMEKYLDLIMTIGFATNLSMAVAVIAAYARFVYLNR